MSIGLPDPIQIGRIAVDVGFSKLLSLFGFSSSSFEDGGLESNDVLMYGAAKVQQVAALLVAARVECHLGSVQAG